MIMKTLPGKALSVELASSQTPQLIIGFSKQVLKMLGLWAGVDLQGFTDGVKAAFKDLALAPRTHTDLRVCVVRLRFAVMYLRDHTADH